MDYADFTTDLPPKRTVFRSVEEHEETMRRLGFETVMRQVGTGSYRSDLAVRRTEQADLHAVRHNKAFWNLIQPPVGKVALMMIRNPIGRVLVSGKDV